MKPFYAIYLVLAFLVSCPLYSFAQEKQASPFSRKWFWPDQAVLQFAGNIGFLSAGLGYSLKQDKMNVDILYGFTPGFEAQTSIHTITGKFIYSPRQRKITGMYSWEPFQLGLGVSYSLGSQFYTTLPNRYPDGYYFWTTSFRLTPFIGTAVSKPVGNEHTVLKRIKGYAEIGTHDLAILSMATNKTLTPWNIISFAFGLKGIF